MRPVRVLWVLLSLFLVPKSHTRETSTAWGTKTSRGRSHFLIEEDNLKTDRFGRTQRDLNDLEFWLVWNGATLRNMKSEILETSEGCGVVSKSHFKKDDTIALIPRKLLMTTAAAVQHSSSAAIVRTYFSSKKRDDWRALLSIFLLEQRANPHSFWQPYARSLPRSLHHLPSFWGKKTRSWLQGSTFETYVEENRKEILNEWNTILDAVPLLGKQFTYEEYLWAASIVQSRSFAIATEKAHKQCGGQSEKALVPLADLLNHRKQGSFSVGWGFDRELDAFKLKAYTAIRAGDALTDSYGESKSMEQFVRMYGFVPSTSHNDDGKRLPPSMVSRSVNATHRSLRRSLLYWFHAMREDRAIRRTRREEKRRASDTLPRHQKTRECDDPDADADDLLSQGRAPDKTRSDSVMERTKEVPVAAVNIFETSGGDVDDDSSIVGSASFRIRAKILHPEMFSKDLASSAIENPLPMFVDDSKFIAYLRGIAQTFVSACDRAGPLYVPDFDTSREKALRGAIAEAVAMMKMPFRAIRVSPIDADAESLAFRMFADALGDTLRNYTTTLEEDAILLRRSREQSVAAVLLAEAAERRESERERMEELSSSSSLIETDEGRVETTPVVTYNQQVALQLRIAEKAMVSSLRGMAEEQAKFLNEMGTLGRRPDDLGARVVRIPKTPSFAGDYLRVLGRIVWVKWRKGNFWYKGHVSAVHRIDGREHGDMRFSILFDDGDREDLVTPENVLWGANPDNLGLREVKRLGKNFLGRVLDAP